MISQLTADAKSRPPYRLAKCLLTARTGLPSGGCRAHPAAAGLRSCCGRQEPRRETAIPNVCVAERVAMRRIDAGQHPPATAPAPEGVRRSQAPARRASAFPPDRGEIGSSFDHLRSTGSRTTTRRRSRSQRPSSRTRRCTRAGNDPGRDVAFSGAGNIH